jgi:hypothetical protein
MTITPQALNRSEHCTGIGRSGAEPSLPTIGIGLMLLNDANVVLMLDYLGVYAADEAP